MTLDELRLQIDDIDNQIRELFVKRMRVAENIAITKRDNNLPIYQPQREAQLIEARSQDVPEDLKEHYKEFLQYIMDVSKKHQSETIEL